jgi:hypothetical protein
MLSKFFGVARKCRYPFGLGTQAPTVRKPRRCLPRLEELESRAVPSASVYLSSGVLHVDCDNTGNWIVLFSVSPYTQTTVNVNHNQQLLTFNTAQINNIQINGGTGADQIHLFGVPKPTTVNGNGSSESVDLGPWLGTIYDGSLVNVRAPVTVNGSVALTVDASQDSNNETPQLNVGSLTGITPLNTPINYGSVNSLTVRTTRGNNTINVTGTPRTGAFNGGVTLVTGPGTNIVNVQGITAPIDGGWFFVPGGPLTVSAYFPGSAGTTVNVGLNGSVQGIGASLTVLNPPWFTNLNVDDHNDGSFRTVTHDSESINGDLYGRIDGLAPADIYYKYGDTDSVRVKTGAGGAAVNVLATARPITFEGWSNNTTVNVGSAGSLQGIQGSVTVENPWYYTALNVDDSNDSTGRQVTLDRFILVPNIVYGRIAVQGSAPISYKQNDTQSPVSLRLGAFGNVVTVQNTTSVAVNVDGGAGTNTLVGPNTFSTWAITGADAGTLNGVINFSSMQNLTGGSAGNNFMFFSPGSVSGTLDGGVGGTNKLDYSLFGGDVLVDLQLAMATNVGGSILNIQNVTGSSVAGGSNILVGDGGNNMLIGGNNRRNLLIAGTGAIPPGPCTLVGGNDQDILIAGWTDYDLNLVALQDIMGVWTGANPYLDRVNRLAYDPSYPYPLTGGATGTVHSNGGGNMLFDQFAQLDLIYATAADLLLNTGASQVIGIV